MDDGPVASNHPLMLYETYTGTELGLRIRGGKSINKFFFETPSKHLFRRKMLCPQYFHNKS